MTRRWVVLGVIAAGVLGALAIWRAVDTRPPADRAGPFGNGGVRDGGARLPGAASSDGAAALFGDHAVVTAGWGSQLGQLGRKGDPETAAEGPMSLRVAGGEVWILDQVNRRIQRWKDGKVIGVIPIGGDTAQDFALGRGDTVIVLDRLGEQNLQLHHADGRVIGDVPLKGKGIPEGGGVTGLFTDRDGNAYVEREHRTLVRVADASGAASTDRPTLPGRPRRDGRAFLNAAITDRAAGLVSVRVLDADGTLLWETPVGMGAPVLHLVLLDSDAAGNVYVAGEVGRESPNPPYQLTNLKVVIVGLAPNGSLRATLSIDAAPAAEEAFRPLTVGDDGTVYRMRRTAEGVVVEAFRL